MSNSSSTVAALQARVAAVDAKKLTISQIDQLLRIGADLTAWAPTAEHADAKYAEWSDASSEISAVTNELSTELAALEAAAAPAAA